jgi:hypothetical protein
MLMSVVVQSVPYASLSSSSKICVAWPLGVFYIIFLNIILLQALARKSDATYLSDQMQTLCVLDLGRSLIGVELRRHAVVLVVLLVMVQVVVVDRNVSLEVVSNLQETYTPVCKSKLMTRPFPSYSANVSEAEGEGAYSEEAVSCAHICSRNPALAALVQPPLPVSSNQAPRTPPRA